MLNANIVGNSVLLQAAYPHFIARGGASVIFVSSIAGTGPSPGNLAYGVCKRALIQMAESLAVDWGAQNIRVNVIAPGVTISENTRPLWENAKLHETIVAGIPLGRLADADDMAAAAVWLASRGGAMVTGQTIVIDGGSTLRGAGRASAKIDFKAVMSQQAK